MFTNRERFNVATRAAFVALVAVIVLAAAVGTTIGWADGDKSKDANGQGNSGNNNGNKNGHDKKADEECEEFEIVPFEDTRMIIEFNSTDEDVGVQFFVDAEEWQSVRIFDPDWERIFTATAQGALREQGGGSELFLESVEPELQDLPLDEFFKRFPEGTYHFIARADDCVKLVGSAEFSHVIPAGPEIVQPAGADEEECAEDVPIPAVIQWEPVTESIDQQPVEIKAYEVIVEGEGRTFDVFVPADATSVEVPAAFLHEGVEYDFEILAIAEEGNQTISSSCFVTAE